MKRPFANLEKMFTLNLRILKTKSYLNRPFPIFSAFILKDDPILHNNYPNYD